MPVQLPGRAGRPQLACRPSSPSYREAGSVPGADLLEMLRHVHGRCLPWSHAPDGICPARDPSGFLDWFRFLLWPAGRPRPRNTQTQRLIFTARQERWSRSFQSRGPERVLDMRNPLAEDGSMFPLRLMAYGALAMFLLFAAAR